MGTAYVLEPGQTRYVCPQAKTDTIPMTQPDNILLYILVEKVCFKCSLEYYQINLGLL